MLSEGRPGVDDCYSLKEGKFVNDNEQFQSSVCIAR